ncbi:MAG TPA: DUF4235 domain-containing protein [Gemmatimonadaceae bacterium]|nr:DUF4235 domain-containing protein [Gemmatimonadaceae bacterium]
MGVATAPGMKITERQKWLAVAGLASLAAGQLATRATSASWELAAGNDPPEDPTDLDFDWMSALLFGAITGAVAGAAVVLARGGAGLAWKQATGKRPPRPRKRSRR